MVCTFFGHRNYNGKADGVLKRTIIDLIENYNVKRFLVGNNGAFDSSVAYILKELKKENYDISYNIVLAYLPTKNDHTYDDITMYPEGLELVLPKFAISKRNEWMIERSDYVIGYIDRDFGNAWLYFKKASKKGKTVINIADFRN